MGQQIAVAVIVTVAALYSAWSLMPGGWRQAAALKLARGLRRWGMAEAPTARLEQALGNAGGCSECSSCKGCATPAAGDGLPLATIALPEKFSGRRQP